MEGLSVSKGQGPNGRCPPDRRSGVRSRTWRRARGERGQALVEFALVIPVLMLILLGILKFGILYNNYLQLTDAVRSGARQMSIERGQGDPCGDAAGALIASANLGSGLKVKITDANPADSADIYTFAAPSGPGVGTCPPIASGDAVTVAATYPCDLNFMGINFFSGCAISSSATERVE
jgi:TadE-like protein